MTDVAGRVAFITGGVSGIGLGVAKAFAKAGARLVVTYRREDHLHTALQELGDIPDAAVHPIKLDVSDREQFVAAVAEAESVFGKIHVLCNSAGVNLLGPMDLATLGDWEWILAVNLYGVINSVLAAVPRIKAHGEGGHVVNIGSMSSFITGPMSGVYATSKFAVRGLTESLRYTLAPHGIAVSLVSPGLTKSNISESPAHAPGRFLHQITRLEAESQQRWHAVQNCGMDADEVGVKTLRGVLRNDFHIFTHPEFQEELRELADEVLGSLVAEPVDPARMAIESKRRQAKHDAQLVVDRLRPTAPSETRCSGAPAVAHATTAGDRRGTATG